MTAANDGSRLRKLGPAFWIDTDTIHAVRIRETAELDLQVILTTTTDTHLARIPYTYVGPGNDRTTEQAWANAEVWLLDHLGPDELESIDYSHTTGRP